MQSLTEDAGPYSESGSVKRKRLLAELNSLTEWHCEQCREYRRIIDAVYGGRRQAGVQEEIPFLPVRLFKTIELVSVPRSAVMKTLTSSGTSGQQPSRIFLDRESALRQSVALTAIMKSYLGPRRLPMAIVDQASVLSNREAFSARGAGILGYSQFGRDHCYFLDDAMQADWNSIDAFLARHHSEPILLFGFTYIVWKHLYQASLEAGQQPDFSNCILVHGGGWKRLVDQQVSNEEFKRILSERFGFRRIHNYYGMVEQAGSIFMECEAGFLHASAFSDVLVRRPDSLEIAPAGESGLLQLLSTVPRSYPGHSLLTEDLGAVVGEDNCACGRKGRRFLVHGRLPQAELRGCSDTRVESR